MQIENGLNHQKISYITSEIIVQTMHQEDLDTINDMQIGVLEDIVGKYQMETAIKRYLPIGGNLHKGEDKNMDKSDLAVRMKRYEQASKTYLTRRMPVVMRIDGKAFHTFTRGFKRPFDDTLRYAMKNTMKYLCENIQGCVLGYTQSDEITLVLVDYKTHTSEAWFDYNVQKMCSVGASMATMAFNRFFSDIISTGKSQEVYVKVQNQAMFDCRAFNIPKEDVCNNLIWRQQDATRNSIQLVH